MHAAEQLNLQAAVPRRGHEGASVTRASDHRQCGAYLESVWVPKTVSRLHIRAGVLLIPIGQECPVERLR